MKRLLLALPLLLGALFVPPIVAGAGPDCAYGEIKLYTHWYQSGLQGSDCADSTDHGYDVNFGDSLDAFRTVDNNDTDSWQFWVGFNTVAHIIVFWDSAAGTGANYQVCLPKGGVQFWGNLPSTWINRVSRYSVVAVSSC